MMDQQIHILSTLEQRGLGTLGADILERKERQTWYGSLRPHRVRTLLIFRSL